ncbi:MAG: histidine phosphotransferase family protein [Alphaproteobacteria bacterium]|nr:histidine phosphotransferase family protein [Alphaproteobacteria bacterium]
MKYAENIHLMQHWISHVCHELVSPIGAINNGIELMSELDPLGGDHTGSTQDALDLIAESGRMASAKLRFYRLAYGISGSARDTSLDDIQKVAQDFFSADGRIAFSLQAETDQDLAIGVPQLVLNLLLMASHCLPRGGTITCSLGPKSQSPDKIHSASVFIRATGVQARIPEKAALILSATASQQHFPMIDHRNCHTFMCACLLQNLSIHMMTQVESDAVIFCFEAPLRVAPVHSAVI